MISANVIVVTADAAGVCAAGVCAAVATARTGTHVALLEPGTDVGGMTSGGLGYTDVGDVRALA